MLSVPCLLVDDVAVYAAERVGINDEPYWAGDACSA